MRKTMRYASISGMNYRRFVERTDFYFLGNTGYY